METSRQLAWDGESRRLGRRASRRQRRRDRERQKERSISVSPQSSRRRALSASRGLTDSLAIPASSPSWRRRPKLAVATSPSRSQISATQNLKLLGEKQRSHKFPNSHRQTTSQILESSLTGVTTQSLTASPSRSHAQRSGALSQTCSVPPTLQGFNNQR
nr:hypothetical protein Iba_chr05fCG9080 [Ipomoea batatas]